MSYDIIVRFPDQKTADEFCGQMSDGWGEGFCDFSFWRRKEGADLAQPKNSDFEAVYAPDGTRIYFVDRLFELE